MSQMEEIDKLFRDAFENESIAPPVEVKNEIDKRLFGKIDFLWLIPVVVLMGIFGLITTSAINVADYKTKMSCIELINNHSDLSENMRHDLDGKKRAENKIVPDNTYTTKERVAKVGLDSGNHNQVLEVGVEHHTYKVSELSKKTKQNSDQQNLSQFEVNSKNEMDSIVNTYLESMALLAVQTVAVDRGEQNIVGLNMDQKSHRKALLPFSLYSGVGFSKNRIQIKDNNTIEDVKVREGDQLQLSAEVGIPFSSASGIAVGLGYEYATLHFDQYRVLSDSILTGGSWNYTMDSTGIIVDSTFVPVYSVQNNEKITYAKGTVSTFVLPVYFQRKFRLNSKWNAQISVGVRLRYKQINWNYAEPDFVYPDYKKLNLDIAFRPELNYNFRRSSLGVYGAFNFSPGKDLYRSFSEKFYRANTNFGLVYRYYF